MQGRVLIRDLFHMKLLLPRSSREDILGGLEYLLGLALIGGGWKALICNSESTQRLRIGGSGQTDSQFLPQQRLIQPAE